MLDCHGAEMFLRVLALLACQLQEGYHPVSLCGQNNLHFVV